MQVTDVVLHLYDRWGLKDKLAELQALSEKLTPSFLRPSKEEK